MATEVRPRAGELSEAERDRRSQVDPSLVRAFLRTELGRSVVRRYLVECATVEPGMQALVLVERERLNGTDVLCDLFVDELRAMGALPVVQEVDALFPRRPGTLPMSFLEQDRLRFPRAVSAGIRAADLTIALTAGGLGHGRYNIDGYTLTMYDARKIYEAQDIYLAAENPDALSFPTDLLRVVADRFIARLVDAAERGAEFRLTNPWGTDVRFTVLPGDVGPFAGIVRPRPDEKWFNKLNHDRLIRSIAGVGVTQTCEGTFVTTYCTALGGQLEPAVRAHLEDGFVVDAEGGPAAARLMEMVRKEPAGVHAILFGMNPRYVPFRGGRYVDRNAGAGTGQGHMALGGAGLFYRKGEWGTVGRNHLQLGDVPKVSLALGEEWVIKDGRLLVLDDPEVRKAAAAFGDPDELLRPFPWPTGAGWDASGPPALGRARVEPRPPLRPVTGPASDATARLLEGYLRLALAHPDGPATARALERVFEVELTDAAPFHLDIEDGHIDARPGSSGLDWRYRDWEKVTCLRTNTTAIADIVAGTRTPPEVVFDHDLGLAPRHLSDRRNSQVTTTVWLLQLFRLADEQARIGGRHELVEKLLAGR